MRVLQGSCRNSGGDGSMRAAPRGSIEAADRAQAAALEREGLPDRRSRTRRRQSQSLSDGKYLTMSRYLLQS